MIRPILTEIGVFLLPFAAYALFILLTRSRVLATSAWPIHIVGGLVGVALALVMISLVLLAQFSGAPPGSSYAPAHIENGRLVPGIQR